MSDCIYRPQASGNIEAVLYVTNTGQKSNMVYGQQPDGVKLQNILIHRFDDYDYYWENRIPTNYASGSMLFWLDANRTDYMYTDVIGVVRPTQEWAQVKTVGQPYSGYSNVIYFTGILSPYVVKYDYQNYGLMGSGYHTVSGIIPASTGCSYNIGGSGGFSAVMRFKVVESGSNNFLYPLSTYDARNNEPARADLEFQIVTDTIGISSFYWQLGSGNVRMFSSEYVPSTKIRYGDEIIYSMSYQYPNYLIRINDEVAAQGTFSQNVTAYHNNMPGALRLDCVGLNIQKLFLFNQSFGSKDLHALEGLTKNIIVDTPIATGTINEVEDLGINPTVHLKSTYGLYRDSDGVTGITSDSQSVWRWNSVCSSHYAVPSGIGGTSKQAPTYRLSGINNLPYLNFAGLGNTDDNLVVNNVEISTFSIFTVWKPTYVSNWYAKAYAHILDTTVVPHIICQIDDWGTSFISVRKSFADNSLDSSFSHPVGAVPSGRVFGTGVWTVCLHEMNGTHAGHKTYRNNYPIGTLNTIYTNNPGSSSVMGHFAIGTQAHTNHGDTFRGDLAEIIIYSPKLSEYNTNRVYKVLAQKYNISISGVE